MKQSRQKLGAYYVSRQKNRSKKINCVKIVVNQYVVVCQKQKYFSHLIGFYDTFIIFVQKLKQVNNDFIHNTCIGRTSNQGI